MKDDVITYIACVRTLLSKAQGSITSHDYREVSQSSSPYVFVYLGGDVVRVEQWFLGGVFGYDRDPSS